MSKKKREHVVFDQMLKPKKRIAFKDYNTSNIIKTLKVAYPLSHIIKDK